MKNKQFISIWLFSMFLYTGMWLSKYLQPLSFNDNNNLRNFGISYTVMAFAGAFSFIYGKYLAKFSIKKGMLLGVFLYSIGMFLRIYSDLYTAIVSGLVAGVGASITFICLSSWPFEENDKEIRNKMYGYSLLASNLSKGVIVTGIGFALLILTKNIQISTIMIIASSLPILGYIICNKYIPDKSSQKSQSPHSNKYDIVTFFKLKHLIIYSIISGFSVSFILPYLPILLQNRSLTEAEILIVFGIASLITASSQPFIIRFISPSWIPKYFLISVFVLALSTLLLSVESSLFILILLITIRVFAGNGIIYAQRTIEMNIVESSKSSESMGILQSAFLIGDAFGGGIAGLIWTQGYSKLIIVMVSILIVMNGIYLYIINNKNYKCDSIKLT